MKQSALSSYLKIFSLFSLNRRWPILNKVLLFDFDGTLADTFEQAYSAALRIYHDMHMSGLDSLSRDDLRLLSVRSVVRKLHIPFYRIPGLVNKIRHEFHEVMGSVAPVNGIIRVLQELKQQGCILGIVTSNSKPNVDRFLLHHGLDLFAFGSYSAGIWSKKSKIHNLIKKHKLNRDEIIFIGDTIEDVAAARAAGVKIAAVTWGYASIHALEALKPDYLLKKPSELLSITA